ncbi:unnamed protein product [Camellia sinensis]
MVFWCLDEYWYYSLFTLFMLFMFESTMAKSRLKTLTKLRRVRVDGQTVMVHRCGKWVKLSGMDLLPGDVVSIGRSTGENGEDKSVPADMLILAGSAIVNEAILTGESTPQWKSFLMKTPDGGCLAVVLRTGFETSQGKLMRTILFSTERVTANSWESGLFILFLVVFAVITAGYVLKKGLEDPTRSKYKLFLSCSLIITSVIPPELPMELSIAVKAPFVLGYSKGIRITSTLGLVYGVFVLGDSLGTINTLGVTNTLFVLRDREGGNAVQIVQRHHFASHLKRMAVVVRVPEQFLAFVKGAPETIQDMLIDLPSSYVKTYKKYTRQGSRVLALAYKFIPEMTVSEARSLDRDVVESGLTFAGFAVFNCPIRGDSSIVLSELKASSHDLVMITGDQALTACHVASQVHIISKPALILCRSKNGEGYEWVSPDETEIIGYSEKDVETLSETHDLCIGGDCFEMLQRTFAVFKVIPYVKVFARVAPEQKELIMTTFKTVGRITLMCGDGTNDVGALKQAHVGVALLNAIPSPSTKSKDEKSSKDESTKSAKSKKPKPAIEASKASSANGEGPSKSRAVARLESASQSAGNRNLTAAEKQQQKLKKLMEELNEEGDGRSAPIVKLGDASMASPFTAKHTSVAPTTDIIRQGRSTLVTTLQMFKVLGLNCLATAYVLSVMYLDGVKLGDVQATIRGVFTAAFFLFISHARPLSALSAERPRPNIFCSYVFLSLLGQFSLHLVFLISSVREAEKYMPEECMDLNDWLKLVPLPSGLRDKLLLWAFLMFLVCYTWERLLRWAFPGKIPAWKKKQQLAEANLEKKRI